MNEFGLWFFGVLLTGTFLVAITSWLVAERDERRWRRRLEEQRMAALIREKRYGSSKEGKL